MIITSPPSGLNFAFFEGMKKKESLWELLKRLDHEAGQYNYHLHEANRYFDHAAIATKKILDKHEKDLHKLVRKIKKAVKTLPARKKKQKKKDS